MDRSGVRRLATAAAVATLALILAGGFVTTTRTGDTIPTWPYSWGRYEGGAWIEWTHRAVAGVVILLIAALTVMVHVREDRAWVRKLSLVGLAAVIFQAVLGGLRVHLVAPVATAIVHATLAQLVFGIVIAIALSEWRIWREARSDADAASAARLGWMATGFAFLQLVAGAVTRHTGAGLTVHLVGAVLVLLHASLFGSRLMNSSLRRGAILLMSLLGIQMLLGIAALAGGAATRPAALDPAVGVLSELSLSRMLVTTTHVAVGAIILATSLALTLLCSRCAVSRREPQAVAHGASLEPNRA